VSFASLRGRGPVDRERLATACHESGHAVVGCLLGAVLDYAEVLEIGPCSVERFGARVRGWTRFTALDEGLHRARIAAAGPAAEVLFLSGGRRPTVGAISAALDGQGDGARLQRFGDPWSMVAEVVPLVDRCWPSVSHLARRLYRGERISQPDVLAALGCRDEAGLPFLAALTRSELRVPRPLEAVT
jgi:hypothetical protein